MSGARNAGQTLTFATESLRKASKAIDSRAFPRPSGLFKGFRRPSAVLEISAFTRLGMNALASNFQLSSMLARRLRPVASLAGDEGSSLKVTRGSCGPAAISVRRRSINASAVGAMLKSHVY